MHFWKKRLQRAAALFCTLALCAGMVPSAAFAQEPSAAAQVSLTQQSNTQGAPEGETTPPESTPAQVAAELEEGATVPEEGATVPEEGATVPEEGATVPEEGATVPEEGATVPEEGATVPEEGATVPEEGATVPEEGATVPEEGATVPGAAALQTPAANAADDAGSAAPLVNDNSWLDGDYAYIGTLGFSSGSGYENKSIMTGTEPWDSDDANGNDTSASNGTVRSFDVVTYTVEMQNEVRDNSPHKNYKEGTFHYELILPAGTDEARFELDSMGWVTSKPGAQHEDVYTTTYNGQTVQVLRGSFTWSPSGSNPTAIGESTQTLGVAVRVLAMTQGETIQPLFTFWMDHNAVPPEGLVTGSNYRCQTHNAVEYKTLEAPEITVTTAPRYNVALEQGWNTNYLGTFDFGTGNDQAQNQDAGTRNGRVQAFGVTLQVQGKPGQGLRGCEIPDASKSITLDLKLSSTYTKTNGGSVDAAAVSSDGFAPLLWSAEGNKDGSAQQDGRTIVQGDRYAFLAAPFNSQAGSPYQEYACKNGGTWAALQNGDTVSITVSGYEVDLNRIPNTVAKNATTDTKYYDPAVFESGYWNVPTACFSAGEIWVVQPFTTQDGTQAGTKYGDGQFNLTVEDVNLRATGVSGNALANVTDNNNQATTNDDRQSVTMALEQPGEIEQYINYSGTQITNACHDNGRDWSLKGAAINITEQLAHLGAEGLNTGVAYDDLMKFDDAFFDIENAAVGDKSGVDNMTLTLLYGAKPDKNGWDHKGKQPNEAGYDEEMINATADDLIFFTSLQELESQGYTCVAVLLEARGVASSQTTEIYFTATGKLKDTATDGNVYMVTHSAKAWNKGNVQKAAAQALQKDADALTDEDYKGYAQTQFPSRAGKTTVSQYASDYPAAVWTNDVTNREGLKNYKKSEYDENGYKDGTANRNYGDSCLVVNYATQIGKRVLQQSGSTQAEKLVYDLDSAQNAVDYALDLSAVRTAGAFTSDETTTTTVYVEDVLPENLRYIPYSANLGGEYHQTGEGKQGQVTGGTQIEPQVTEHGDGTTTLRWTLTDQTITADATTKIGTIYYSCDISNEAQNNDPLPNTATIWSEHEQRKDFSAVNGNEVVKSIRVSKNSAVSLSKTADQTRVETGKSMGFTMNVGNNAANPLPIIAVDSLPYSGEGSASAMHGDSVVTEFTITELAGEFANNFKLYYTENKALQGKGSADFQDVNFANSTDWKPLTVEPATGKVTLPEGTFKPVAIAAVGSLPGNQTLKMQVTITLPEGEPGDRVVNRLTMGNMESNGRSYLFGRTLEGLVWLDADKDGLQGTSETKQNGVTVTLLKLKDGGDAGNLNDYKEYTVNDRTAAVTTGQTMDLLTGKTTTGETGAYKFLNLPEGTFAVRFDDGGTITFANYAATTLNAGDDTIDSDATGVNNNSDGKLDHAYIAGIVMPAEKEITGNVYEVKHQDLGLVEAKEETVEIQVTKKWNDNNNANKNRPAGVTVQLYANGTQVDGKTLTLSANNNWADKFTGLPKTDDDGEIKYTVKEVPVTGYESKVTGTMKDGFTITNTPETVDINGSKTWDDNGNADGNRPTSITINLLANGVKKDTKTVTEKEGWKWSFTDLPKYANGAEITYSITEDTVPNYTSEVNGYDVTNTYAPGKTQVTVAKVWDDSDDVAGFRPGSVTVQLLANGEDTNKTVTLEESNNWTAIFGELNKDSGGKPIEYTVKEVLEGDAASKYTVTITGDADTEFTITNKYTPETIEIPVEKVWQGDTDDTYNNWPDAGVTVTLYNGETPVDTLTLNEANHWQGKFANLPKYENGAEIEYTVKEVSVAGYKSEVESNDKGGFTITNTLQTTRISGTKTWDDANDQDGKRPGTITIQLLADGKPVGSKTVSGNGNTWNWSFENLPVYRDGNPVTYTVKEEKVDGYSTTYDKNNNITNTYTPGKTSVTVTKNWDDANNQDGVRPGEITVRLYADGQPLDGKTAKLNAGNGWQYTFENLDENKGGKKITYTVQENAPGNGYKLTETKGDAEHGFILTNAYTPKTTEVTVTKQWVDDDDRDGIRPEKITVQLLADGEVRETATVTPDAEGNWAHTFTGLPVYKDQGKEIQYTVQEVLPDGYTAEVSGKAADGFTITNTHEPKTTEVKVTKQWVDDDDRDGIRPEKITVQLLADGEVRETATVTPDAEGNWAHTFTGLPVHKDHGKEIQYTVQEVLDADTAARYTSELSGSMADGFTITNTYEPERIDLQGAKTWDDHNDQDGKRPDAITVHLYADGAETPVQTLEVKPDSEGNWNWKFTGLHKYRDQGVAIQYTVEEEAVDGYAAKVEYKDDGSHALTNTHTPEVIDIPVTKVWDDAHDQDGKRPDAVTVRLYADGQPLEGKVATLSANTGWKHTFTDLPKYRDGGIEIVYTITEDAVSGYTTEVDNATFTVTNRYTPGKTSVGVTKNWDDNGNQDGMRPAVIEIKLLADGADTGKTLRLSTENGWSGTFGSLDEYKAGKKIHYSIQEVGVHGYESSISGDAVKGYVVTNRHVPERVEVSGHKIWRDASNQSLRPDCITIRLLANERAVAKVVVTAEDDWQWTFTDLPKYENGKQIVYSISEDKVEGYTTTIDGYNVINTSEWEALAGLPAGVIPQTGDDMPVGLLAGLAAVAAGGLAALWALRKRRGGK